MNQQIKTLLISSTLLAGSFGGAVALPQATGTPAKPQTQMQEPSFTGSITLPQDDQSEGAEAAAYGSMATVSLDQAVKAAQGLLNVSDAPTSAQLDNENGFLVWEVVIGDQAVKVDAGDAKVLQTEQVGAEEEEGDNESNAQEDEQADAQEGQEEGDESDGGQEDEGDDAQEEQNENGAEDGG